jgi:ribose transport system substrate-binding protein
MHQRSTRRLVVMATVFVLMVAACSSAASPAPSTTPAATPAAVTTASPTTAASTAPSGDPLADVSAASLVPPEVVSKGPNGETTALVSDIALTDAELEKVKAAGLKLGIVMQTMDIEWSTEQVRGMTDEVARLGGTVVGVCNGAWDVTKQSACVDNMLTKGANAIVSIPVDDKGMAPAYARVSEAGAKLIFIDSIGAGLQFGTQYQGLVTSDVRGMGQASANALSRYLPQGATAGILDFGVDFETTKQRMYGFKEWMAANRPDVEVKVEEFQDPATSGTVAANFLTANPDVAGMFTEWEVPAMGILTALRSQGKTMPITDVNMAADIALDMASGGMIKMIGSQRPYDEGVAEALMAGRAVAGIENPPYLAFPAVVVLRNNLLSAWALVYKKDAPKEIQEACGNVCR